MACSASANSFARISARVGDMRYLHWDYGDYASCRPQIEMHALKTRVLTPPKFCGTLSNDQRNSFTQSQQHRRGAF
jgi:hypothetical protein